MSLGKNFLILGIGEVGSRLLGVAATLYLTRRLTVSQFGLINFSSSYVSYFALLTNLGLLTYAIRTIAQSKREEKETVNLILSQRLLLAFLSIFLLMLSLILLPQENIAKRLILLYSFFIFLDALLLEWFFQAKELMHFLTISRLFFSGSYFILLLLLVKNQDFINFVPVSFIAGFFVSVLFLLLYYQKKVAHISWQFNLKAGIRLVKNSLPLGLAQLFAQVYTHSGIIVLGFFPLSEDLGIYSSAFRVLLFLFIFDRILYQIFLPFFSKRFNEIADPIIFQRIIRLVLLFILPLVISSYILAPDIFLFLFPKTYFGGSLLFKIFLCFFFFTVLNTVFSLSLIAFQKEKRYFRNMLFGTLFNILFVVLGVRFFSAVGAALALSLTEGLVALFNIKDLLKLVKINLLKPCLFPFFIAILVAVVVFIFRSLGLFISAILGILTFIGAIYFLRNSLRDEFALLLYGSRPPFR